MRPLKQNKKASEVYQIFNIIITVIVVGLILLVGSKAVIYLMHIIPSVSEYMLVKDVTSVVKSYSTEYGSQATPEVIGPSRVKYLCFTDYGSSSRNLRSCNEFPVNKIIEDSYSTSFEVREKKNVFMLCSAGDYIGQPFFAGNVTLISVAPEEGGCNYLCIPVENGYFHFNIIGLGDSVRISEK